MSNNLILTINPGSTSTKIAIYRDESIVFLKKLSHEVEELDQFNSIADQFSFRKDIILKEIEQAGIDVGTISCVVGRGGLVKPIESGVYEVNEALANDLKAGISGEHASNLGGLIADDIAKSIPEARAFIADPVVVDELSDVARVTGHPEFERRSIFHALNHKAMGRKFARVINKDYEDLNLIIAHLGGGISVGAHERGRVVDVNQALDGEGPFSPERSGTLPVGDIVKMCYSGKYTKEEMSKMIKGKGGFAAYLGTNDAYEVELKVNNGDEKAKLVNDAMAYQVAKEIGAMATVLKGKVDAIIITGGIAYNRDFVDYIKQRVRFIAAVDIFPGEDEMLALAQNGLRVMRGEIEPKVYE